MLRKLGAYPRQNGLAVALRELGRIERTLFTLEWLQNTELRRRVQIGLNKGEAKNALARAVFFNRLGEIRDRLAPARPLNVGPFGKVGETRACRSVPRVSQLRPIVNSPCGQFLTWCWDRIRQKAAHEAGLVSGGTRPTLDAFRERT